MIRTPYFYDDDTNQEVERLTQKTSVSKNPSLSPNQPGDSSTSNSSSSSSNSESQRHLTGASVGSHQTSATSNLVTNRR